MRPVVDQDRDSGLGELIARQRKCLGAPHDTEFAYDEDVAVGGLTTGRRVNAVRPSSAVCPTMTILDKTVCKRTDV